MNYCPFALPTVGKRVPNPNLFDNNNEVVLTFNISIN